MRAIQATSSPDSDGHRPCYCLRCRLWICIRTGTVGGGVVAILLAIIERLAG